MSLSVGLNADACDSPLQSTGGNGDFGSRTWQAAEFDEEEHQVVRTGVSWITAMLRMRPSWEPTGSHLWAQVLYPCELQICTPALGQSQGKNDQGGSWTFWLTHEGCGEPARVKNGS